MYEPLPAGVRPDRLRYTPSKTCLDWRNAALPPGRGAPATEADQLNTIPKWALGVVMPLALINGCSGRPSSPSERVLELLPPSETGRALFPGELLVGEAAARRPISLARARALRLAIERAAEGGDWRAGLRLEAASGRLDAALRILDRHAPDSDGGDLAAERGAVWTLVYQREQDPLAAVSALENLASAPASQATAYNRIVTLCALGLSRGATEEWQGLNRDLGSSVVAARVARSFEGCLETAAESSERRPDEDLSGALRASATGDDQPLRDWIGQVGLQSALSGGGRALDLLREPAARLAQSSGDDQLAKMVEELERSKGDHVLRRALAACVESEAQYRALHPEAALHRAQDALEGIGSRAPAWRARALLTSVAARFQLQDYDAAIAGAVVLRQLASVRSWHDALGRSLWLEGLSRLQQERPADAESSFERARSAFEKAAEPALAANAESLRADAFAELGDLRRSLSLRVRSLGRLARHGLTTRRLVGLESASVGLTLAGFPRTALEFLREAGVLAASDPQPLVLAEQSWWRSSALRAIGARDAAQAEAERGLALAPSIGSRALRERTIANLQAARGAAILETDPALAEREIGRTIESARAHGFHSVLARLLVERARALRILGRSSESRGALEEALAETERAAAGLGGVVDRALFFDTRDDIVEEGVALELADRANPEAALSWLLRVRATVMERERMPAARELQVDRERPILVVLPLEHEIVRWRCTKDQISSDRVPIGRVELKRRLDAYRSAIVGGAGPESLATEAVALFDLLLSPLRDEIEADRVGGVLLAGIAADTPVAALRDGSVGRWVGELAELPGLRFVEAPSGAPEGPLPAEASALIVSDPRVDETYSALFPPLPGAAAESELVARIFPRHLRLAGPDATKAAVVERASGFDILHFAVHGIAREHDPGKASLLLAGEKSDSLLTSEEVARLHLVRPRLIVLSSCESGRGYQTRVVGSLSVARAFLDAGAGSVVGTLWEIDDAKGREFIAAFYELLRAGEAVPAALLGARRSLIRSGDPVLRRPETWAGYFLTINATGRTQGGEQ